MIASNISTIPEFFKDKSIFLTGATGFLGKLLVEKLLRSCPDIKTIYVLIRPKKSLSAYERLEKLKTECVFSVLRETNLNALDKIKAISGDCSQLRLGISDEDRAVLVKNVSIIINVAASVRFDDFLQKAILTNVKSTRDIIELAEQLNNIECFLHVSTAYSNCNRKYIEEKIYPPKFSWRHAIKLAELSEMDAGKKEAIDYLTQKFIEPMPNTYVFTKGLAENAVQELCTNKFPTSVFRPSIVLPTLGEPIKGYTDNWNGPISMYIAAVSGISKVFYADPNHKNDFVFADNVTKAAIIAVWQTAIRKNIEDIKVYNVTSDTKYSGKEALEIAAPFVKKNPMKYYLGPLDFLITKYYFMYLILNIFFHFLPSLLFDAMFKIMGQKISILTIRRKLVISNLSLLPFLLPKNGIGWTFVTENYENLDKLLMESDRDTFAYLYNRGNSKKHLEKYMELYIANTRVYLIPNERPQASEAEITRYKWITIIYKQVSNAFWVFVGYIIFWKYNLLTVLWNKLTNYIETLYIF